MLFGFPQAVPVTIHPPRIAHAAGITAGLTTIPSFERRYGKGFPMTGGHSGGARLWYDARREVLIHADGFNYAGDGEILDGFSVEWMPASQVDKKVPRIRIHKSDLGLLAALRRGMSRSQAETAIGARLASDDSLSRHGLILYSPKPGNKSDDRYQGWILRLSFGAKGLQAFTIDGD